MQNPRGASPGRNRDTKPAKPAAPPAKLPPARQQGVAQLLRDEDDAAAKLEEERKDDLQRGNLARAILGRRAAKPAAKRSTGAKIARGITATDDWE